MYISYNWLKELVDFDLNVQELDHALTMLGVEVESIEDYQKKYDKFFTAKVLTKEKHPDADKLSVCTVECAGVTRTVVCGAPNVDAGQIVVLGTEGAVVPNGGFTLVNRAIRKVKSEGMICSQIELDLGEEADGIWVLPEDAEAGMPLANYLQLNDIIFDVSITPNRPDWLSHVGIAREISTVSKSAVRVPGGDLKENGGAVNESAEVIIEDEEKCPRYTARVIKNVDLKNNKTPEWMKQRLIASGFRPINLAADATNFVMIEMGQPLHAFDLDKIAGNKIVVKTANQGEKFTTLDDKEHELNSDMLMICDAEKPVAIAGVMGGGNSEITDDTVNILLESAFFNPSSVRKTSKKLTIQSESSYRFERGADIGSVVAASNRAAQLIAEYGGGEIDRGIIDVYPNPKDKTKVTLRYDRANKIIGLSLTNDEIKAMLESLQFVIVEEKEDSCVVEAPYFRVDILEEIDLVEEIARMYNYEKIEPQYSSEVNFSTGEVHQDHALPPMRQEIRSFLIPKGFKEIITQNMIDPKSAALFTADPVTLANPLGLELSIMRPSMIPSMMKTILHNIRIGNRDLQLFEIGRTFHHVHEKEETFIEGRLEKEELMLALTGAVKPKHWAGSLESADFYSVKGILEEMIDFFRLEGIKLKPIDKSDIAYSKNSLRIMHKKQLIGFIGDISAVILKKYDIERPVFVMNLDLKKLYAMPKKKAYYSPVPPYPGMSRDLAFLVDDSAQADKIKNEIIQNGGKLLGKVDIFDVYKGKNIEKGKKSIAFNLTYSSPERTLVEEEVQKSIDKIINAIEKKFNAQLRAS